MEKPGTTEEGIGVDPVMNAISDSDFLALK
jgi:hypothetical protein